MAVSNHILTVATELRELREAPEYTLPRGDPRQITNRRRIETLTATLLNNGYVGAGDPRLAGQPESTAQLMRRQAIQMEWRGRPAPEDTVEDTQDAGDDAGGEE